MHSCIGANDESQDGVSGWEYSMHKSDPDELTTPHLAIAAFEIYSNSNEHLIFPLKCKCCVIFGCACMCKCLTTVHEEIKSMQYNPKKWMHCPVKSCCFATD